MALLGRFFDRLFSGAGAADTALQYKNNPKTTTATVNFVAQETATALTAADVTRASGPRSLAGCDEKLSVFGDDDAIIKVGVSMPECVNRTTNLVIQVALKATHVLTHTLRTVVSAGLPTLLICLALPAPSKAQQQTARQGMVVVANAIACEPYRRGILKTERVAVRYEPANLNPNAYNWTEIRFRPQYLPEGMPSLLPGQLNMPNISELFYIDLDGQPLPKPPEQIWRHPQEDMYFQLLINGLSYNRSPERMIGILSGSKSYTIDGYMENGVFVEKPTPFERTGEMFYGYERIVVPDAAEFRIKDHELFISTGGNSRVNSVLECSRVGAFPNPQCALYEKVGVFETKTGFRRTLMPQVDNIVHLARAFVSCLTWKGP